MADERNRTSGQATGDRVPFDRQPPQDLPAEQSVLGGMMLSKDAIADVVEVLKPEDFYRPAHQAVYDCVLDLYGRGEPADAVTVSAELERKGDLGRVGGAPYLHTLIATVPTAANAGYYAQIVSEKAVLRRLVEAGTRITQLGYGSAEGTDVDDVVDRAQSAIYEVTERRMTEDYVALEELLQPTMDEIDAIASRGGISLGVPTGFVDLDEVTNGLHPGQMIIIAARPGIGKALALDTPLATPTGWSTMGEIQVGQQLLGADGKPTTVVGATDVLRGRPCYEVEFSDGSVVVADGQHQWRTTTRASRRQSDGASTHRWPQDVVHRVAEARDNAPQFITFREATELVGAELGNVLHSVAAGVECGPRVPRTVSGEQRRFTWVTPTFAGRPWLTALHSRVSAARPDRTVHDPVITTEQIAASLRTADGRLNHAVTNSAPLELAPADLPVAPYVLGAWLGDGHTDASRFTTGDAEIIRHIENEGYVVNENGPRSYSIRLPEPDPVRSRECAVCAQTFQPRSSEVMTCGRGCGARSRELGLRLPPTCPDCGGRYAGGRRCQSCHRDHGTLQGILRSIGVLGNKHIPVEYLRASAPQRRALLAGLLDTDGAVTSTGGAQFTVTNERLAQDTRELIVSLGYRCRVTTRAVRGRFVRSSTAYTLNFTPGDDVFGLTRKRETHRARRRSHSTVRTGARYIVDVRPVTSVPVRCVEVDNADHMYLAGRAMIPTHNSTLGLDIARSCSIKHGMTSVIFSLEMSRTEIVMRMLSAEARIRLQDMRGGKMTDDDWTRLARRMSEISEAPLFVDDSPNMTMMEIRAKARRLSQRNELKLIVVDYMQLMTSGKKVESRQQEVSEFSRQLKLLAKELEVPVVAISQLNRGPEQRTDKRPMLSDLRESGSLEQDADMVLLINRPDASERDDPRAGEADLILAKHRAGPMSTITVAHQLHYSRFTDLAQG